MSEKRTPAAWSALLFNEHEPITIQEYAAGIQARLLTLAREQSGALTHIEGILGSIDVYMTIVAQLQGIIYPGSQEVREALAYYREHKRQETLKELTAQTSSSQEKSDA